MDRTLRQSLWLRLRERARCSVAGLRRRLKLGAGDWDASPSAGIEQRRYQSYAEYVALQRAKLNMLRPAWLKNYDQRYHAALQERLCGHQLVAPGASVLCLAARIGTEVRAFLDTGCFAVGIDLNPGAENRYVVTGDFHGLQYPNHCVDVVFTNSLDHALDLPRLLLEIQRVLKPGGLLVLEIAAGEADGRSAGFYEATRWDSVQDILALFLEQHFTVEVRQPFRTPWPGEHVVLRASALPAATAECPGARSG